MKILAIFIDMISGEKLNLCNEKAERTVLDDFIENFGGTLYTYCYTPAPDTPRSFGCMYTGLYPKENGCDSRWKYPQEFMNAEKENIWDVLKELNYDFQIFMRAPTVAVGMLPKWVDEYVYPDGTDLEGFLDSIEESDNMFTFICFPDFHTFVDMFQASSEGVKRGEQFVKNLLDKIFAKINPDDYDDILIFSDHGFRAAGETHRHLLERDRVQTLMLWRRKEQKKLSIDDKLRSNLDFFPTICEMVGYTIRGEIDGKSLSGEGHEYILMEDHRNFQLELGQTIERWAVLWEEHIYWLDVVGWDMFDAPADSHFDQEKFEKLISEKCTDYQKNKKLHEVIHKHDKDTWREHMIFSDGTLVQEINENIVFQKGRGYITKNKDSEA